MKESIDDVVTDASLKAENYRKLLKEWTKEKTEPNMYATSNDHHISLKLVYGDLMGWVVWATVLDSKTDGMGESIKRFGDDYDKAFHYFNEIIKKHNLLIEPQNDVLL
jgi:hypothetical protein